MVFSSRYDWKLLSGNQGIQTGLLKLRIPVVCWEVWWVDPSVANTESTSGWSRVDLRDRFLWSNSELKTKFKTWFFWWWLNILLTKEGDQSQATLLLSKVQQVLIRLGIWVLIPWLVQRKLIAVTNFKVKDELHQKNKPDFHSILCYMFDRSKFEVGFFVSHNSCTRKILEVWLQVTKLYIRRTGM